MAFHAGPSNSISSATSPAVNSIQESKACRNTSAASVRGSPGFGIRPDLFTERNGIPIAFREPIKMLWTPAQAGIAALDRRLDSDAADFRSDQAARAGM
jgi:hypothetical protein